MNKQPKKPYSYSYYYGRSMVNNSGSNNGPPNPPVRKTHHLRHLAVFVVIMFLLGGGVYLASLNHLKPYHLIEEIKNSFSSPTATVITSPSATALATMGTQINSILSQNSDIDMAVSLINPNNNQSENYGDQNPFTAASTTKVITAAYFLNQVEAGSQSLNENVGGKSAEDEVQQMIVLSDDTAWDNLRDLLGYSNEQSYAQSIGLDSFNSVNNTLSCSDMALIMEKLWEGKLLSPADTDLLLGYLKDANYRQYIVPAVPHEDMIYHKAGFYGDNVDDAAIITSGQKVFVIVIYTNGNGEYDWNSRAQIMQSIVKVALPVYL